MLLYRSSPKRYIWAVGTFFVKILRWLSNKLCFISPFCEYLRQKLIIFKKLMNQSLISAHQSSLLYLVATCHMCWKKHTRLYFSYFLENTFPKCLLTSHFSRAQNNPPSKHIAGLYCFTGFFLTAISWQGCNVVTCSFSRILTTSSHSA